MIGVSPQYIKVVAPHTLSFSRNSVETIKFFDEMKRAIFTDRVERRKGETRRKQMQVTLEPLKQLSVPCAVVLGSELKRWAMINDFSPRLFELNKLSPNVINLLGDLGCFSHLGISKRVYKKRLEETALDQIALVELTSAELQDASRVSEVQRRLGKVIQDFARNDKMHRALVEATNNSIEHAYQDELPLRFPPRKSKGRWYATASYDAGSRSLRFFVYDQGAGIPASLRSKPTILELIKSVVSWFDEGAEDAGMIEAAFEMGRSTTKLPERGKGLRDILKVLEIAGSGYLRIISGQGDVKVDPIGNIEKFSHQSHIGGTLIEWSLPLDALWKD